VDRIRPGAAQFRLFLFFLLFLPGTVFGADPAWAEISAWLRSEPKAESYRGGEARLREIFEEAVRREAPAGILFEKLKEGAAKQVSPEIIIQVLRDEIRHLVSARAVIRSSGLSAADPDSAAGLLKICSLALRGGLSEAALLEVLRAAAESGKGPSGAVELVPLLIRMQGIEPLPSGLIGPFCLALFSGRLPAAQYGSLVSLYLKAAAGKVSGGVTIRLMTDILKTGGGIVRIERELTRRIKKP
jgi:hypothetical protein